LLLLRCVRIFLLSYLLTYIIFRYKGAVNVYLGYRTRKHVFSLTPRYTTFVSTQGDANTRYTYTSTKWVCGWPVRKNDDKVRYVDAVTCCWSEHRCTNVGKRRSRVGVTSRVAERHDGRLDIGDRPVGVQVKTGDDARRVRASTDSCNSAVNVEVFDHLRDEELCLCEDGGSDVPRRVYDEDDVERRLCRWS